MTAFERVQGNAIYTPSESAAREGRPVTTPKPPTLVSVSATLRTAEFRAHRDGRTEGYEVERSLVDPGAVIVDFSPDWGDDSTEAHRAGEALRIEALDKMAAVLRRKGWAVTAAGAPHRPPMFLLVKEK